MPPPPRNNSVTDSAIITYIGFHTSPQLSERAQSFITYFGGGSRTDIADVKDSQIFSCTIGINPTIFDKWFNGNKAFTVDVEIGSTHTTKNNLTTTSTYQPISYTGYTYIAPGYSGYSSIPSSVSSSATTITSSVTYVLLNGNYDINLNVLSIKNFAPYLTAGIGFQSGSTESFLKTSSTNFVVTDSPPVSISGIICQLGAGFSIPVFKAIAIDGRVRVTNIGIGGTFPEFGIKASF